MLIFDLLVGHTLYGEKDRNYFKYVFEYKFWIIKESFWTIVTKWKKNLGIKCFKKNMQLSSFSCNYYKFLNHFRVLRESPRWLVERGRISEAAQIIRKATALNKVTDIQTENLEEVLTHIHQVSNPPIFSYVIILIHNFAIG